VILRRRLLHARRRSDELYRQDKDEKARDHNSRRVHRAKTHEDLLSHDSLLGCIAVIVPSFPA
jgi:hypothetical protein